MSPQRRTFVLPLLFIGMLAPPGPDFSVDGNEILDRVRDRFMDAQKAARWAEDHAGYADKIQDRVSFRDATRRILTELETSHTEYYTPDDPGYHDLLAIFEPVLERDPRTESLGFAAVERNGGWFVLRVFVNGPAEAAGLRRGERIVSADGEPFHPKRSLQGKAGKEVALEVQSRRGEAPRTVHFKARFINPKDEWLQDQGAGSRVLESKGRHIAYAPLWSCAGTEHQQLLKEIMAGAFAEADALIIDFRGGWGGCDPGFVQLFDPAAPDLIRIDRDGTKTTYSPSWRKPLAVLIDSGTRSGKEVVSRALQ
ncbi:MAG TPA: S41 family peptidase, partial [Thermoanaerobaculia bacterium]|nr:S41 family peptidase [Thermoanaerobaculia bacterium]